MDRTEDFTICISGRRHSPEPGHELAPSPFVLKASQLLEQLISFETLIEKTADSFIDYHRFHPEKVFFCCEGSSMSDKDRMQFSQEIAVFVTTFASEVKELRQMIGRAGIKSNNSHQHQDEVLAYLLERLAVFTKLSQRLQKEREKYSLNPFTLLTSANHEGNPLSNLVVDDDDNNKIGAGGRGGAVSEVGDKSSTQPSDESKSSSSSSSSAAGREFASMLDRLNDPQSKPKSNDSASSAAGKGSQRKSSGDAKSTTSAPTTASVSQSFVDRYEAEIAPPAKLKEYQSIASKHKEILLKESKNLQVQYSEDYKEAQKMERTVSHISNLLMDFVRILQQQRDSVDDVHSAGKAATEHVSDTGDELRVTIERTESHQKSMVMLIVGMGLMLLILDFVTP